MCADMRYWKGGFLDGQDDRSLLADAADLIKWLKDNANKIDEYLDSKPALQKLLRNLPTVIAIGQWLCVKKNIALRAMLGMAVDYAFNSIISTITSESTEESIKASLRGYFKKQNDQLTAEQLDTLAGATMYVLEGSLRLTFHKYTRKVLSWAKGQRNRNTNYAPSRTEGARGGGTLIVQTGVNFTKHGLERLAQRGITKKMADVAIKKGLKFYDPKNKSINYILRGAFGSGKDLLISVNSLTGEVCTVIRGNKLIRQRMIPIK